MNILPIELPRFVPNQHEVWISDDVQEYIRLIKTNFNASSWWILTDSNVEKFCYPRFQEAFNQAHNLFVLPAGEESKTLASCEHLWQQMEASHADKNAVLICLGGGMITDLGGFAASCWKRGIRFIFIPTSLLGMVDASIGGKTGIDLTFGKNLLGLISIPSLVVSDTSWLSTLPEKELKAGYAECLKHGLVADETYWRRISGTPFNQQEWEFVVYRSQLVKSEVVKNDPDEQWMRKILNFGHTIGHALESLSLELQKPMLHGEAVALGMLLEAELSLSYSELPDIQFREIKSRIEELRIDFPLFDFTNSDIVNKFIYYIRNDKKNQKNEIRMSLLNKIGKCSYDIQVTEESILKVVIDYFKDGNN